MMPSGRRRHRGPSIADKARSARANRITALAPIIAELRATGLTSLNGIAAALDRRCVGRRGRAD
jgi:hypothetical protein